MKKDILTWLKLFLLNFNKVDDKKYNKDDDIDEHDIYVFNNMEEFYSYFFENIDYVPSLTSNEIFNLAILSVKDDGTIIASRGICHHIINSLNEKGPLVKKLNRK